MASTVLEGILPLKHIRIVGGAGRARASETMAKTAETPPPLVPGLSHFPQASKTWPWFRKEQVGIDWPEWGSQFSCESSFQLLGEISTKILN